MSGSGSGSKVGVNFVCQRCMIPIKLDSSFSYIDEHTLAELNLPLYTPPSLGLEDVLKDGTSSRVGEEHDTGLGKLIGPNGENGNNNHGFTIVASSSTPSTMSGGGGGYGSSTGSSSSAYSKANQLRVQTELLDILSNNTEIDHPLCDECSDILIQLLENELRLAEEESNQYSDFLKKLESEPDNEDIESLESQLKELKNEENILKKELNEMKIIEAEALETLQKHKADQARLKEQEELFLKEYCKHKRQLAETEDQYQSFENELRYVQGQLERLEKTNALNATFHIWHSGHFGTINTFRLGRLPSEPVDWNEINAAWGQTALLLNSLARKMNFKFSNYQIVPFGNHSYIKVLSDNSELPLFGSGGFRFLWDTKFDQGMCAFLELLGQLQTAMLERPGQTGFALPYRMGEKGKIEDPTSGKSYSIKIQLNSEEPWTKALKFMLTNLKWALAWVSSQTVQE